MTCQLQQKIASVLRKRNIVTEIGQQLPQCSPIVQYES
jgi:hypothetical protein